MPFYVCFGTANPSKLSTKGIEWTWDELLVGLCQPVYTKNVALVTKSFVLHAIPVSVVQSSHVKVGKSGDKCNASQTVQLCVLFVRK